MNSPGNWITLFKIIPLLAKTLGEARNDLWRRNWGQLVRSVGNNPGFPFERWEGSND